jgi:uncharacterized MAPEG superfamily protein
MTTEIWWLAAVSLATALMWIPSTLALMREQGMTTALGNRDDLGALSPWAARAKRAHENAVHNLVLFAAVVLAAHAAGATGAATATATMVYFWARIVHYLSYAFGVIGVRTLAFAAGWVATIRIGWAVVAG